MRKEYFVFRLFSLLFVHSFVLFSRSLIPCAYFMSLSFILLRTVAAAYLRNWSRRYSAVFRNGSSRTAFSIIFCFFRAQPVLISIRHFPLKVFNRFDTHEHDFLYSFYSLYKFTIVSFLCICARSRIFPYWILSA